MTDWVTENAGTSIGGILGLILGMFMGGPMGAILGLFLGALGGGFINKDGPAFGDGGFLHTPDVKTVTPGKSKALGLDSPGKPVYVGLGEQPKKEGETRYVVKGSVNEDKDTFTVTHLYEQNAKGELKEVEIAHDKIAFPIKDGQIDYGLVQQYADRKMEHLSQHESATTDPSASEPVKEPTLAEKRKVLYDQLLNTRYTQEEVSKKFNEWNYGGDGLNQQEFGAIWAGTFTKLKARNLDTPSGKDRWTELEIDNMALMIGHNYMDADFRNMNGEQAYAHLMENEYLKDRLDSPEFKDYFKAMHDRTKEAAKGIDIVAHSAPNVAVTSIKPVGDATPQKAVRDDDKEYWTAEFEVTTIDENGKEKTQYMLARQFEVDDDTYLNFYAHRDDQTHNWEYVKDDARDATTDAPNGVGAGVRIHSGGEIIQTTGIDKDKVSMGALDNAHEYHVFHDALQEIHEQRQEESGSDAMGKHSPSHNTNMANALRKYKDGRTPPSYEEAEGQPVVASVVASNTPVPDDTKLRNALKDFQKDDPGFQSDFNPTIGKGPDSQERQV